MPVIYGHNVTTQNAQGRTVYYVDGQIIGDASAYETWKQGAKTTYENAHAPPVAVPGVTVDKNSGDTAGIDGRPTVAPGDPAPAWQINGGLPADADKFKPDFSQPLPGPGVDLNAAMTALANRQPIAAPGAAKIAQTAGPTAATVAYTPQAMAARVAGPGVAPTVDMGPARTVTAVAPKLTTDTQQRELSLADMLQGIISGGAQSPEALQARKDEADQEAAQMSLASSAGPAGRASALRSAMQNVGRAQAASQGEIASRNLAAQQAAQQSLIGLLSNTRGADVTENQNVAQAENTARGLTAQLGTQKDVAGIGAQAQLGTARIGADTTRAVSQAELANSTNLANAAMAADKAKQDASFQQQSGMQTSAQAAAAASKQAELDQQSGQFGAGLSLQQQGQNDSTLLGLVNASNTQQGIAQQGQIAREQMTNAQYLQWLQGLNAQQIAQIASMTQLEVAKTGASANDSTFWDYFSKIAPAVLAAAAMAA